MGFLDSLASGYQRVSPIVDYFAGQEQERTYNDMMAANPQYAQQYYAGLNAMAQQNMLKKQFQQEQQKRSALADLAKRLPQAQQQSGLADYAGITGDFEPVFGNSATTPAAVREFDYYNNLDPQAKIDYLKVKRSDQILNTGGGFSVYNPATGGAQPIVDKTLPPEQLPSTKAEQEMATNNAKFNSEFANNLNQNETSLKSAIQSNANIATDIDKIMTQVSPFTTGVGATTAFVNGTPAANLKANVDSLMAKLSFGELQNMRNSSPTGGALGAVSERELQLLSSAKANVSTSQSPAQLKENLERLRQQMISSTANIQKAYQQDLKRFNRVTQSPAGALTVTPQGLGGATQPSTQRSRLEELRAKYASQ